jgi:hypothetical protein
MKEVVSVDVVENTPAHSVEEHMHCRLRDRRNDASKGWGLAGMMMDGNITLGVDCHPKTITAHHNPTIAWEVGIWDQIIGGVLVG